MAIKFIKLELPDDSNELLYVKKFGSKEYRGYKTEYLEQNLSTIEQELMSCKICCGIMRAASLYQGEIVCLSCSGSRSRNPVKAVQNSIATIKIKCPLLRNCDWKGPLSEAELHLSNCMCFVIQCGECEETFTREEKEKHDTNVCPFRIILCSYCNGSGRAKDQEIHLEQCDEFPLCCPNNCGKDFPRGKLSLHRSQCELEVIECPYKQYGCEATSMLRRDLLAHKKENIVEHTDLSLYKICDLESEILQIKDANNCLEENVTELKFETKIMKKLDGVNLKITNVNYMQENEYLRLNTFFVNSYKITAFCRYKAEGNSTGLHLCIKRINGNFDRNLGISYITQYRLIIVNQVNYEESKYREGRMSYQLQIGLKSHDIFLPEWDYSSCLAGDDSLCIRMYFDVNASPLENLRPVSLHSRDPDHDPKGCSSDELEY